MNILITPRGFANYGSEQLKYLKSKFNVIYNNTGEPYTHEEFTELAKNADGIIVGVDNMDKDLLDQCLNLKVICKFGVGTDNIDLVECERRNIVVGRTVGSNSQAVAEHVIAMLFSITKNLYPVIKDVKNNGWAKPTGFEVSEKTFGIVGYGAIGQILGRLAKGLGMSVVVYDAFPISSELIEENGVKAVSFDNLVKDSDFISLHVPLTEETTNLFATKQFTEMKNTAVLLNASRGGVVNEKDLYLALKEGLLVGAGFDVFSTEPPQVEEPLLKLDNFILTSHTAARTVESEIRTCKMSAGIVADVLLGEI